MQTLNRFRPALLTETLTDAFGIEVYYNTEHNTAIFYAGNSKKAWWYNHFHSLESMLERIYKSVDNHLRIENEKIERRAKQKAAGADYTAKKYFNVGDVVYNSWGYEQTNIDFYQVTEVLGKKIRVRELKQEIHKCTGDMSADVIPILNEFHEDKELLLLTKPQVYSDGIIEAQICNPKSFYYFKKWDGKPKYSSWYN